MTSKDAPEESPWDSKTSAKFEAYVTLQRDDVRDRACHDADIICV